MDLRIGLPTNLISEDNTFIEWTNEERNMWLTWKKSINPQVRTYLLNDNKLIIHGYIRNVGLALSKQQIIPLKIIQLILFYFPIFNDLIIHSNTTITLKSDTINKYSMISIGKNAKLSVTPWTKYNLNHGVNGGKLIIKCDILILNEYSSIDVCGCGLSYDCMATNKDINFTNSDNLDIVNMNLSIGQGKEQNAEKYGYYDYGYDNRGGGSIDVQCKNQILMGHGSAIIANGKTGVDCGGDIRIICDELNMNKTAKIEATIDGKIIIGVNKNKKLITTENIAPTPILAQNVNNKWKLLEGNENEEDTYWDNYFKNNSFLPGNDKL